MLLLHTMCLVKFILEILCVILKSVCHFYFGQSLWDFEVAQILLHSTRLSLCPFFLISCIFSCEVILLFSFLNFLMVLTFVILNWLRIVKVILFGPSLLWKFLMLIWNLLIMIFFFFCLSVEYWKSKKNIKCSNFCYYCIPCVW